jgi:hypothetical protein
MNIISSIILSIGILLAGFFFGGRYTVGMVGTKDAAAVYVIDRVTGEVRFCVARGCGVLADR